MGSFNRARTQVNATPHVFTHRPKPYITKENAISIVISAFVSCLSVGCDEENMTNSRGASASIQLCSLHSDAQNAIETHVNSKTKERSD